MTISSTWQKYNLFASLNDKPTKIGQIVEQKDSAQKIIKRDTIYDFNNDGISDLKVYQKNGKISVFINQNQINSSQPQWKGTSEYGSTLDDVGKNIIAKHLTPTIKSVPITTSKNNPFQISEVSTESSTKKKNEPKSDEYINYTVKKGESLGLIAKKYNCSIQELKSLNNIKNENNIKVKQILKIPNTRKIEQETQITKKQNVSSAITLKSEEDYFEDLGFSESSGRYNATLGRHSGKYQMSPNALIDIGYIDKKTGKYTRKSGVSSREGFLNSPKAQEKAVRLHMKKQWSYIKKEASKKIGTTINGIPITYSGLLAATHLVGQGKVNEYLRTNGKSIAKDANGTSLESYLRKFANYDVSEFTGDTQLARNY